MRVFSVRVFCAVLASTLLLTACSGTDAPATETSPASPDSVSDPVVVDEPPQTPEDNILAGIGTIEYVNLEGGFYGIVDEETGQRYNPDALPDSLRIDGIRVEYRARPRDVMTIQMWGRPIEIISIEQLE